MVSPPKISRRKDEKKMKRFDSLMNDFLDLTVKSGQIHRTIKSKITRKIKKS